MCLVKNLPIPAYCIIWRRERLKEKTEKEPESEKDLRAGEGIKEIYKGIMEI